MFPEENRYEVKGTYELVNNAEKPIDSLLLYIDRNSKLTSVEIKNAKNLDDASKFQHYWYRLEKPLQPHQKIKMSFSFKSTWSPFKGHTAFNSIIDNGSFMRISRYYPLFGYQDSNEISSEKERAKRHLKPQQPLKKLEDKSKITNDFIDYEAIVSTSKNQTAIGIGDLIGNWKKTIAIIFIINLTRRFRFDLLFHLPNIKFKKQFIKAFRLRFITIKSIIEMLLN